MSRSLLVFFLDLVAGEIWFMESHKLQIWLYSLFLLRSKAKALDSVMSWRQCNMKVLARQHEERGYRFRWRGLIVGTAGVYPRFLLIAFDLLNVKVRLILVSFCQRRPGILKTHCFGLVAEDKCHDIVDHFSYAGSGRHKFGIYFASLPRIQTVSESLWV
ncbi:hypothetical protein F2Q69_00037805 [Brassica cretica]|uniref:Uncharacterized protein n=1 Tax=Brassica cretica TaxID=69181 RepID=A0A8S9SK94_BRACR|nr:hypothetical protein F2Q69_00037805 [Brassica cretica]